MKKLIAIIGILIILFLYITTFILAILNKPGTAELFKTSIYATIVIPILMYIYLWLYRLLRDKNEKP